MHYNTKTIARLAAVQAMYWMISDEHLSSKNAIEQMIAYYKSDSISEDYQLPSYTKLKPHRAHLTSLITFAMDSISISDDMIAAHTDSISIHDSTPMSNSLLATLRIGITELKFFPETSHKIIINEYTNIAAMLLKEQDVAFVNSCLDFVYNTKFSNN